MRTGEAQDRGSSSRQARWVAWSAVPCIRFEASRPTAPGSSGGFLDAICRILYVCFTKAGKPLNDAQLQLFFSFCIIKRGRRFRRRCHPETASHSEAIFWVAVSAWGTIRKSGCPKLHGPDHRQYNRLRPAGVIEASYRQTKGAMKGQRLVLSRHLIHAKRSSVIPRMRPQAEAATLCDQARRHIR